MFTMPPPSFPLPHSGNIPPGEFFSHRGHHVHRGAEHFGGGHRDHHGHGYEARGTELGGRGGRHGHGRRSGRHRERERGSVAHTSESESESTSEDERPCEQRGGSRGHGRGGFGFGARGRGAWGARGRGGFGHHGGFHAHGHGGHHARRERGFSTDDAVCPLADVSEMGGLYIIEVELPGVRKEDVSVRIEEGSIRIEGAAMGETKREHFQADVADADVDAEAVAAGAGPGLIVAERALARGARFARTVRLPGKIEKEGAVAEMRDGVLKIKVVKAEVEETFVEIA